MINDFFSVVKQKVNSVFRNKNSADIQQNILEQYRNEFPSHQVGIDIFKDEWSSRFPDEYDIKAGGAELFQDARVNWLFSVLGDLKDYDILELGPLEAGHTYMLDRSAARSILAIEANTRAYLKCLVAKEVTNMKKVSFLCGDFCKFLEADGRKFDLIAGSGVLYHMENPVKLIADISKHTDRLFIWTHFFDQAVLAQKFPGKFDPDGQVQTAEYAGFKCNLHLQLYQQSIGWAGFCGGMKTYSYWLEREDIMNCLKYFGFTKIEVNGETLEHPNGPCFTLLATK